MPTTCEPPRPESSGATSRSFKERVIKRDEISRYYSHGRDFIDEDLIHSVLESEREPDPVRVRDILAKSMAIESLEPAETACLLQVGNPDLRREMEATALAIKHKVYNNRIVTFAPMYISNYCVNRCRYCGFSATNRIVSRRTLTMDEIRAEARAMAGRDGHKRVMAVYGEHPDTGAEFIAESLDAIYSVKAATRKGYANVRRINVNAAPLGIEDLKIVQQGGIGTFQVFQETYHHATYADMHPADTIKGDYDWRLTCMHRAFDAGIDDVGLGVLFGLYDWRFEVLGLLLHTRELERYTSGIGPHTISVPRLHPASGSDVAGKPPSPFSDDNFLHAVTTIRLSVPYTGLIVTARETPELRDRCVDLGITQMDASTRIGIGAYAAEDNQDIEKQQFILGDGRTLEQLIRDLAQRGIITSFCTAGYRCGRTGGCIMDALKTGKEGKFCKINAVLTFREWLDDFASPETIEQCEPIIRAELEGIRNELPKFWPEVEKSYRRIAAGERDLYF